MHPSMRRPVTMSRRARAPGAVVVLDMPATVADDGFRAQFRRPTQSSRFTELFGNFDCPEVYTPDDPLGALVPLSKRRGSGKCSLDLTDSNGVMHDCVAESFTTRASSFYSDPCEEDTQHDAFPVRDRRLTRWSDLHHRTPTELIVQVAAAPRIQVDCTVHKYRSPSYSHKQCL